MADFDLYIGLRTLLLADPATWGTLEAADQTRRIAARVAIAAAVGARIYPRKAPQTVTAPYIVLTMVSGRHQNILDGQASMGQALMQVDCYVKESSGVEAFTTCRELGANVRARLSAYAGLLTDARSSPSVTVHGSIVFDSERDDYLPDQAVGNYYRHSADYLVFHGVVGE